MKRTLLIGAAVAAMALAGGSAAEAGGFGLRLNVGGFSGHHHHGHRHYSGYGGYGGYGGHHGYGGYGDYGGYGGYGGYGYSRPYFHDTSHFDYHPGYVVPHGDHYDYVPGHYHLHRQGHWHH